MVKTHPNTAKDHPLPCVLSGILCCDSLHGCMHGCTRMIARMAVHIIVHAELRAFGLKDC